MNPVNVYGSTAKAASFYDPSRSPVVGLLVRKYSGKINAVATPIEILGDNNSYFAFSRLQPAQQYFWGRFALTHLSAIAIRPLIFAFDTPSWLVNLGLNTVSYLLTAARNPLVEYAFKGKSLARSFEWKKYFDSHDQATLTQLAIVVAKGLADACVLANGYEYGGAEHKAITAWFVIGFGLATSFSARVLFRKQHWTTGLGNAGMLFVQRSISAALFSGLSPSFFYICDKACVGLPLASLVDAWENSTRIRKIILILNSLPHTREPKETKEIARTIYRNMPASEEYRYKDAAALEKYILAQLAGQSTGEPDLHIS